MLRTLIFTSLARKDTNILVSSTKGSARQDFTTDGKSFMYRPNNIGPKMDPCGTPWLTVPCPTGTCQRGCTVGGQLSNFHTTCVPYLICRQN